jgi:hypothetical protein
MIKLGAPPETGATSLSIALPPAALASHIKGMMKHIAFWIERRRFVR